MGVLNSKRPKPNSWFPPHKSVLPATFTTPLKGITILPIAGVKRLGVILSPLFLSHLMCHPPADHPHLPPQLTHNLIPAGPSHSNTWAMLPTPGPWVIARASCWFPGICPWPLQSLLNNSKMQVRSSHSLPKTLPSLCTLQRERK